MHHGGGGEVERECDGGVCGLVVTDCARYELCRASRTRFANAIDSVGRNFIHLNRE
jgi:hypothetical protein